MRVQHKKFPFRLMLLRFFLNLFRCFNGRKWMIIIIDEKLKRTVRAKEVKVFVVVELNDYFHHSVFEQEGTVQKIIFVYIVHTIIFGCAYCNNFYKM